MVQVDIFRQAYASWPETDRPLRTSTQVLLCGQRSRCLFMSFTLAMHNFPLQFQLLARLPSSFQESIHSKAVV